MTEGSVVNKDELTNEHIKILDVFNKIDISFKVINDFYKEYKSLCENNTYLSNNPKNNLTVMEFTKENINKFISKKVIKDNKEISVYAYPITKEDMDFIETLIRQIFERNLKDI